MMSPSRQPSSTLAPTKGRVHVVLRSWPTMPRLLSTGNMITLVETIIMPNGVHVRRIASDDRSLRQPTIRNEAD